MMIPNKGGKCLTERIACMSRERQLLLAKKLKSLGLELVAMDTAGLPILPVQRDVGDAHDLSLGQYGIWFIDQLYPENAAYNLAVTFRIQGRLNFSALSRSFDMLAKRHEVLRVGLSAINGIPRQYVSAIPHAGLVVEDIDDFSVALQWCKMEACRPIELTGGPLWRATLLRINEDDHVIILVIHHILADNWSMGVLGRELGICYTALARGESVLLPELPIQYIDFAYWQRHRLESGALDGELAYWRRQLEGVPLTPRLPADHRCLEIVSQTGARRYLNISNVLSKSLHRIAARECGTLFMILVATLKTLLHRYTGADQIIVGTDVTGRNRTELEGLMGFFVNQLVLCTELSKNPTFRELLARVRRVCIGAYAHQEFPFHKVVKVVNPTRSLDRTPLVQVKIDLLSFPREVYLCQAFK